jgi:CheY-like chemotaxis protein
MFAASAPPRAKRPSKPVLIVEDHEDTREMVELFLRREGYAIRTAAHGRDALAAVAVQAPCLILLDVSMPVMDGPTFARQLRESTDRALAATPIVLMTALEDFTEAMRETQARSVVPKPVSFDHLLGEIARHCQGDDDRAA